MKTTTYQPETGAPCSCKRGVQRDNCPTCEGTGQVIDFAAIRARKPVEPDDPSDYEIQARDFLKKWGIKFSVRKTNSGKCPLFCDDSKHIHGDEHRIKLVRHLTGKRLEFPFWNSLNDSQKGKEPTCYDVLACISSDLHCPETFEEFCSEYGDNTDSRKALALFRRCDSFGRKLRAFFDNEEMQADLQNIN